MSDSLEIQPAAMPILATVRPPGSKSITNRALVCAALAEDTSVLSDALDSEDTRVMIEGLRVLGIAVESDSNRYSLSVVGCDGAPPAKEGNIFVANSGTTIRFLTALATLAYGKFRLDGIQRMRERPLGDLAHGLQQLGGDLECEGNNNCPPVTIRANGLAGGECRIRGDISSQFLSGLLMAAPCAKNDVSIQVEGTLVSVPYVTMTLSVMQSFGIEVEVADDYSTFSVPSGVGYRGCDYAIEPDASAASYFWAAAAVTGGEVTVTGLNRDSLQGDVAFVDCLAQMGCDIHAASDHITVKGGTLRGIDVDMNAISDTVQTLAVVALFAEGPTTIRNIAHIRYKETDRIAAVANEIRKLGAGVIEEDDSLRILPDKLTGAAIDTYDDHRMAMSFAIAGLAQEGVRIRNPKCTQKTYPRFFEELHAALQR